MNPRGQRAGAQLRNEGSSCVPSGMNVVDGDAPYSAGL